MRKLVILLAFSTWLLPTISSGQITIGANAQFVTTPGTVIGSTTGFRSASGTLNLSNASIILAGADPWTLNNSSTGEVILGDLTLNGSSTYTVSGNWRIANSLTLTQGKLLIDQASATAGQLIYAGPTDITGGNADSFVEGTFFSQGTGVRTFPVGNSDGYFPVRLDNIVDDATLGFELITGDANLDISQLSGVTDVLRDRHWKMHVLNGTFTGSTVSISTNLTSDFLLAGREGAPTVLQLDASSQVSDLGGLSVAEFVTSLDVVSATGDLYAIGKTENIDIIISEVLTPNGDGKNNVLKIANIELYPDNKVTLLDRYGVEVNKWTAFKNYTSTDSKQDFDFTSLAIGNYICVVEVTNPRSGSKKFTQMITVLK